MLMNPLYMPLKIHYTDDWSIKDISNVMTKTTLILDQVMKVHVIIKGMHALNGKGHPARFFDIKKGGALKTIFTIGERTPPVNVWFVENVLPPPKAVSERGFGLTTDWGTGHHTCIIFHAQHVDNRKFNIGNCGLTVAHELVHALGIGGHQCDPRMPGIMCTYGENKIHPKAYLRPELVKKARQSQNLVKTFLK